MNKEFDPREYGINPLEFQRLNDLPIPVRKKEVQANLESNKLEAQLDVCVSPLCSYWFNTDGKLYSSPLFHPRTLMLNQFEPSERDGVVRSGFTLLEKKIHENPNKVILWFSPPGRKSLLKFDPKEIPYPYGQLYVYYYDGQKVKFAAIKTTGEGMLPFLFPQFIKPLMIADDAERISTTLLSPVVLDEDLSTFLTKQRQNVAVYKDKNGRIYYWNDVVRDLKATFEGKRNNIYHFDKQLSILDKEKLNEDDIIFVYLSAQRDHMLQLGYGYHQEMKNYGACSGKSTSISMIDSILGKETLPITDIFDMHSTFMREARQSEWSYHEGKCRVCGRDHTEVGPCSICKECEKTF